jgi:hypothetical protein
MGRMGKWVPVKAAVQDPLAQRAPGPLLVPRQQAARLSQSVQRAASGLRFKSGKVTART